MAMDARTEVRPRKKQRLLRSFIRVLVEPC
jgi:hypothetical protein